MERRRCESTSARKADFPNLDRLMASPFLTLPKKQIDAFFKEL